MVDDSSFSLNRINVTQSEHTFQPGLEVYTLYINAILFAWNVLWSKSKHKENFLSISPSRHTLFPPTKDKFTIWVSGFWKRRAMLFEFVIERNGQQCLRLLPSRQQSNQKYSLKNCMFAQDLAILISSLIQWEKNLYLESRNPTPASGEKNHPPNSTKSFFFYIVFKFFVTADYRLNHFFTPDFYVDTAIAQYLTESKKEFSRGFNHW